MGGFAHRRKSDIGRLGAPTGVAVVDGRWGRVTAKVGTDRLPPALYNLDPTRPHAPAADVAMSRDPGHLLYTGIANYAKPKAGVRS
jgi:hypothetical protein